MTNSIRKNFAPAIAFIMVFIMAFGTTPAFAAEIGDTVKWYNEDGTIRNEFVLTDIIDIDDTINIDSESGTRRYSYILNAEKAGYYAVIETGYPHVTVAADYENGSAHGGYGYFDTLICNDTSNYPDALIVYLEADEVFFTAYVYDMESATISFEFLGEEITNVDYEQECLEDLIIGCEVAEDDTCFQMQHFSTVDITFSSGKKVSDIFTDRVFRYDAPLKEGENTGYMEVLNHKEPITFTAYPVSKYIESMEITNIEKVLDVRTNYRNEYVYPAVYKETVTVNFTDGTSIEVQPSPDINVGMDFINGHHYNLITHYDKTDDGIVFELGFGKHLFDEGTPILYSAPCKVSELSFSENLKVLSEMISWEYEWVISDSNVGTIFNINFRELYYALKHTAEHISEFIDYYI